MFLHTDNKKMLESFVMGNFNKAFLFLSLLIYYTQFLYPPYITYYNIQGKAWKEKHLLHWLLHIISYT